MGGNSDPTPNSYEFGECRKLHSKVRAVPGPLKGFSALSICRIAFSDTFILFIFSAEMLQNPPMPKKTSLKNSYTL